MSDDFHKELQHITRELFNATRRLVRFTNAQTDNDSSDYQSLEKRVAKIEETLAKLPQEKCPKCKHTGKKLTMCIESGCYCMDDWHPPYVAYMAEKPDACPQCSHTEDSCGYSVHLCASASCVCQNPWHTLRPKPPTQRCPVCDHTDGVFSKALCKHAFCNCSEKWHKERK